MKVMSEQETGDSLTAGCHIYTGGKQSAFYIKA